MKNLKFLSLSLLFVFAISLSACNSTKKKNTEIAQTQVDKSACNGCTKKCDDKAACDSDVAMKGEKKACTDDKATDTKCCAEKKACTDKKTSECTSEKKACDKKSADAEKKCCGATK